MNKQYLQNLLSAGNVSEALGFLTEMDLANAPLRNAFLLVSSRYHSLVHEVNLGTISLESFSVERTRVVKSLLYFIDCAFPEGRGSFKALDFYKAEMRERGHERLKCDIIQSLDRHARDPWANLIYCALCLGGVDIAAGVSRQFVKEIEVHLQWPLAHTEARPTALMIQLALAHDHYHRSFLAATPPFEEIIDEIRTGRLVPDPEIIGGILFSKNLELKLKLLIPWVRRSP